jgi:hypothetical protein
MIRRGLRVGSVTVTTDVDLRSITVAGVQAPSGEDVSGVMLDAVNAVRALAQVTTRPRQQAGDRVIDGDRPGTLATCQACNGIGLVHVPDPSPEPVHGDSLPVPVFGEDPDSTMHLPRVFAAGGVVSSGGTTVTGPPEENDR